MIIFKNGSLFELGSRDIQINWTLDHLSLWADMKLLYHTNARAPELVGDEYMMKWEVDFQSLVDWPGATNDDSFVFRYPMWPIRRVETKPLEMISDPDAPFQRHSTGPAVGRLSIRPHTRDFSTAVLRLHATDDCSITVNGSPLVSAEAEPRPTLMVEDLGNSHFLFSYPGARPFSVWVWATKGVVLNDQFTYNQPEEFVWVPPATPGWGKALIHVCSPNKILKSVEVTE